MALRDELQTLHKHIQDHKPHRVTNHELIDIYNGNLKPYIERHMCQILSFEQAKEATNFIVPINILQKLIDKLSKIYQQSVFRHVVGGREQDSELLEWYADSFDVNTVMNIANEMFNLTKSTLVEPYIDEGLPALRVIPGDRYIPYSNSKTDPTRLTHVTIVHSENPADGVIYQTWTDEEVIIWSERFEIKRDMMNRAFGDTAGINPYGTIPYVYINQSRSHLIPTQDTDMLSMTIEVPNQISYLNYGVGYNAFPITYGIDVDDENLKRAPNAYWSIKSDPQSDKQPQISTIKPVIDIQETLGFIQAEIALWLNSKGIRPGSIGDIDGSNFASGISKMVDEMDAVEARKKQISYFQRAEDELWDLVLNHMHPFWAANGLIENQTVFSPIAEVVTEFIEPQPMQSREALLSQLSMELQAGFISRKRALKKLNPGMSSDEIEALISEIEEESREDGRPEDGS